MRCVCVCAPLILIKDIAFVPAIDIVAKTLKSAQLTCVIPLTVNAGFDFGACSTVHVRVDSQCKQILSGECLTFLALRVCVKNL